MFVVRVQDGDVAYFLTMEGPSAAAVRSAVASRFAVAQSQVFVVEETQPFPQDVLASMR